jgi:hypothetical protein
MVLKGPFLNGTRLPVERRNTKKESAKSRKQSHWQVRMHALEHTLLVIRIYFTRT